MQQAIYLKFVFHTVSTKTTAPAKEVNLPTHSSPISQHSENQNVITNLLHPTMKESFSFQFITSSILHSLWSGGEVRTRYLLVLNASTFLIMLLENQHIEPILKQTGSPVGTVIVKAFISVLISNPEH